MSAKHKIEVFQHTSTELSNDESLALLGLPSEKEFQGLVNQAISAYFSKTPNSAKTKAGTYFYHALVEAIRDVLAHHSFQKLSYRNIELAHNDRIAIYICKGNEDTGSDNKMPMSERQLGDLTLSVLGLSRGKHSEQLGLFSEPVNSFTEPTLSIRPDDLLLETRVLLHRLIELPDNDFQLLLELSTPVSHDGAGRINHFSNRIIFKFDFNLEPRVEQSTPGFNDDLDIPITRTN